MSDPFIGQIMMFGGNFAPRGWALCDGQLLAISQNQALFSILGTTYGGDGRTTFGLPNLRSRLAIHPGTGPGLNTYKLGQAGGVENVVLNQNQMPSHTHAVTAVAKGTNANGSSATPAGNTWADPLVVGSAKEVNAYANATPDQNMKAGNVVVTVGNTGGNQIHTNVQPFQCVNFIIAIMGNFPSRN